MPRSSAPPPPGSIGVVQQVKINVLIKAIKTLRKQGLDIIFRKKSLSGYKPTDLRNQILKSLEISANQLNEIVEAFQGKALKNQRKLRVSLGDLIAFWRNVSDLEASAPAILAFYSIINIASREGINIFVRLEAAEEDVDIQEVPGSRAHTVEVYRAMQAVSDKKIGGNLVEAREFFIDWLSNGRGEGVDFLFRDIFEQATAPENGDVSS